MWNTLKESNIKAFFLILNLIFLVYFANGISSITEFEALSPNEKVNTILKEYEGNKWFNLRLDFSRKSTRIADQKNETLPYIISLLKEIDLQPYDSGKNEFEILDNIILLNLFQLNKLEKYELVELGNVYTLLLDKYLKTYKKIDIVSLLLHAGKLKFIKGQWVSLSKEWIKEVYKIYSEMGYEDLRIDYEEIEKEIGIKM